MTSVRYCIITMSVFTTYQAINNNNDSNVVNRVLAYYVFITQIIRSQAYYVIKNNPKMPKNFHMDNNI